MFAPVAFSVVDPPLQMVVVADEAVTFGAGFTVMVRVAVAVHPFAAVPVSVYVVVVVGETVTGEPLRLPGIQLYVAAPLPVSVVELPAQMVPPEVVVVTVGVGFTVMMRVAVAVQPLLVPVTVYVVVPVGVTVTVVPVRLPGIHVYVVAPFAVIVVELPEQIVALEVVVVIVGVGFTVMVRVAVFVQPFAAVPVSVYVVVTVGETVAFAVLMLPGIQL